jgi:predicted PurR-regulated permease PerM
MAAPVNNLPRIVMLIIAILVLLLGISWVVQPFLLPGVWAVTIVVATWPLLKGLETRFGGRRAPAVVVMTLSLMAIVIVPVYLAISTVIGQSDRLGALLETLRMARVPPPPDWLQSLPFGPKIASRWADIAKIESGALAIKLEPYILSLTPRAATSPRA